MDRFMKSTGNLFNRMGDGMGFAAQVMDELSRPIDNIHSKLFT